ncbi:SPRY domain-containing protein 7 isoform X1 [Antechinus flavipes]|uniref:SPRY domain-containing protein 7 isoform X1 n=1 Tax=Antechinus flavipes TaxID=38775 RepID=UPI002236511A|nr:SPRY domain-containing protein 7 isoform X1 [Antechinus flavipes]
MYEFITINARGRAVTWYCAETFRPDLPNLLRVWLQGLRSLRGPAPSRIGLLLLIPTRLRSEADLWETIAGRATDPSVACAASSEPVGSLCRGTRRESLAGSGEATSPGPVPDSELESELEAAPALAPAPRPRRRPRRQGSPGPGLRLRRPLSNGGLGLLLSALLRRRRYRPHPAKRNAGRATGHTAHGNRCCHCQKWKKDMWDRRLFSQCTFASEQKLLRIQNSVHRDLGHWSCNSKS